MTLACSQRISEITDLSFDITYCAFNWEIPSYLFWKFNMEACENRDYKLEISSACKSSDQK